MSGLGAPTVQAPEKSVGRASNGGGRTSLGTRIKANRNSILVEGRALMALVVIIVVFASMSSQFLNTTNLIIMTRHVAFNAILALGMLLVIGAAMLMVRRVVPEALPAAVQSQPLWLQAIEALLVADIGFYLAHRAFHAVPFLWRFHAIHHSIEEMDWLAAHRVHPVDQILTKSASFLPLFVLVVVLAASLLSYPWHLLAAGAFIYLAALPIGWRAWKKHRREDQAAAAGSAETEIGDSI